MGSTRKFGKPLGRNPLGSEFRDVTLTCGCQTNREPALSSPVKKWFCCGEYRKAKARR